VLSVSLRVAQKMKSTLIYDTYESAEATYQLELFNSCDDVKTASTSTCPNMALRFEVEDTGIGLSDEAMATLFKPSKQAERLASGTGLGLFSLAKRMEALGGSYGVQKRRDGKRGSIFWFEIPYRPIVEPPKTLSLSVSMDSMTEELDPAVEEISPLFENHEKPGRLNILVVDDCAFINMACRQMFKRAGHQVTAVENGADALEIMIKNKHGPKKDVFDVVLMDLQMPVMNGMESTSRLRAYEEQYCRNNVNIEEDGGRDTSHLLIIGVSTTPDRETIKESFIAGVDAFIPKPFNLKSFTEVYTSLVSRPAGY